MSHGEEDLNPQSHLPELLAGIWTQKTIRAKPKWRRGLPAFFFLPLQEAANRERPAICNEKLPACMQKRGDGSQRTTIRISRTTQENQWSAIITATRLDWRGNFSFFFLFFAKACIHHRCSAHEGTTLSLSVSRDTSPRFTLSPCVSSDLCTFLQ